MEDVAAQNKLDWIARSMRQEANEKQTARKPFQTDLLRKEVLYHGYCPLTRRISTVGNSGATRFKNLQKNYFKKPLRVLKTSVCSSGLTDGQEVIVDGIVKFCIEGNSEEDARNVRAIVRRTYLATMCMRKPPCWNGELEDYAILFIRKVKDEGEEDQRAEYQVDLGQVYYTDIAGDPMFYLDEWSPELNYFQIELYRVLPGDVFLKLDTSPPFRVSSGEPFNTLSSFCR